jgi:YD repeat-containing protein
MTSAGSPAGPTVPTWTPPSTYLDRLNALASSVGSITYDSQGRVSGGVTGGVTIASVTYDGQGRISTFTEDSVTRTASYDTTTGRLTGVA